MTDKSQEPDFLKILGSTVRGIREPLDLTLTETAKEAGVSKSYLSNFERGRADNISIIKLWKITNVLDITMVELFEAVEVEGERKESSLEKSDKGCKYNSTIAEAMTTIASVLTDPTVPLEKRLMLASIINLMVKLFFDS